MLRSDEFDQRLRLHMGVDFGRRDVGMAQHRLHRAQVCAAFQQMSGKGVAQHMGADSLGRNACFRAKRTDELEQPHTRQRSEEHTSELPSLMRISYAVFCLKTKTQKPITYKCKTTE